MKIKAFFVSIIILMLLFVIAFLGTNLFLKAYVEHRNEVKVPNLIGKNFEVARKEAQNLKLFVQQVEFQNSSEVPKGRILSQNPAPDKMTKISRTIEVSVSNGPELVRVPYLDNITANEALVRLKNANLVMGKKESRYSDIVEAGKIIYSDPAADELVAKGSVINIVESLGKLPDSSGDRDRWRNLLEGAGAN